MMPPDEMGIFIGVGEAWIGSHGDKMERQKPTEVRRCPQWGRHMWYRGT